ncbi:MAG TPA: right-handed parallel beta-helix repeat-containing protein [Burkholderiales bacterium]|nr:right-handed parallel beta-helix repeat-containing protein [Burkholderiales bacterium]
MSNVLIARLRASIRSRAARLALGELAFVLSNAEKMMAISIFHAAARVGSRIFKRGPLLVAGLATAGAVCLGSAVARTTSYALWDENTGAFQPTGRILWVDINSVGGPCSDSRTRDEVTSETPWCNLGPAGSQVMPGDTVRVRGGDYTQVQTCDVCENQPFSNSVLQVVVTGDLNAWIRYQAVEGETVRVIPTGDAMNGVRIAPIAGRDVTPSYIEVSGFQIHNAPRNGVVVRDSENIVLRNLDITGSQSGSVELSNTANLLLEASSIHENPLGGFTSAVDLFECRSENVIRGNRIWSNRDTDPNQTEGHGIIMDFCEGAGGALIENNVIWDNDGSCIAIFHSDGAVIRHNTCWSNGRRLEGFFGEVSILGARQAIHNNILLPSAGRLALNFRNDVPDWEANYSTTEEDYNLLWAPTHTAVVAWSGIEGTVAEYQAGNPQGWGAHTLQSAPVLVDPLDENFHLASGSPAIDSGDESHSAAIDADGVTRPRDGDGDGVVIVDRGAFEE